MEAGKDKNLAKQKAAAKTKKLNSLQNKSQVITDPSRHYTLESRVSSLYHDLLNFDKDKQRLNKNKETQAKNKQANILVKAYNKFTGKDEEVLDDEALIVSLLSQRKENLDGYFTEFFSDKLTPDKQDDYDPLKWLFQEYFSYFCQDGIRGSWKTQGIPITVQEDFIRFFGAIFEENKQAKNAQNQSQSGIGTFFKKLIDKIQGKEPQALPAAESTKDSSEELRQEIIARFQKRIENAEYDKEAADAEYSEASKNLEKAREEMSQETQRVVNDGLIDKKTVMRLPQFLSLDESTLGTISPLVAVQLLQVLMDMKNLETTEDVKKYGITITEDELSQSSGAALDASIAYLRKVAQSCEISAKKEASGR